MRFETPEIHRSIQRMVRTACGAEANASCNCGVAYQPKSVRAAEAVMANPEKSDRAIAKEIGSSPTTVGKAREQLSSGGQLKDQPRTGLDGKTRKLPKVTPARASAEKAEPDPAVAVDIERLRELVAADPAGKAMDTLCTALDAAEKAAKAAMKCEHVGDSATFLSFVLGEHVAQIQKMQVSFSKKYGKAMKQFHESMEAERSAATNNVDTDASAEVMKANHAERDLPADGSIPDFLDRRGQ